MFKLDFEMFREAWNEKESIWGKQSIQGEGVQVESSILRDTVNNSRLGQDACWVLTGQVEKEGKEARVQWEGVGAFSWEHRSGPGM